MLYQNMDAEERQKRWVWALNNR